MLPVLEQVTVLEPAQCGSEQVAKPAPKVKVSPPQRQGASAPRDMSSQNQCREERKRLYEVRVGLIYPARQTAQRRHWFFPRASRPSIPILEADEVRVRDQMHQPEDDAGG